MDEVMGLLVGSRFPRPPSQIVPNLYRDDAFSVGPKSLTIFPPTETCLDLCEWAGI